MIARIIGPGHETSAYEISDGQMATGSTLGSPKGTVLIKATGALEKFYSCEAGQDVFGTLVLHHWDEDTGVPLVPEPGEFVIHPSQQEHRFTLAGGIEVSERIFVLSGKPSGQDLHEVDPPGAYYTIELCNGGTEAVTVATFASLNLRGSFGVGTKTRYDALHHAFVVSSPDAPDLVRIAACSTRPQSYEVTTDSAKASAALFPGRLRDAAIETCDDPIGIFRLSHRLRPGAHAAFHVTLTFSTAGEAEAFAALRALPAPQQALTRTQAHYDDVLGKAIVITPDQEVNRGVLWAKANMLRCESLTSQGWCFVNDPTRSNNSVARDTAWFGFGADYVQPEFARESLIWYADHLEENGMVVEYFDVRTGKSEDYGLNINDDTPLLILALWHHYNVSGDREFLEYVYPKALRAAEYILSQRDKHGLIWCTAQKTADWGIVGWRNVIEGYRLSGATTEVNSECYAALDTLAKMSQIIGDDERCAYFDQHAKQLRAAINEHLLDTSRNVYYLNLDLDGTPRTDITCDLIFPVMFGVAEHEVAANIIARLSTPEFWSEAGLHTVPRNDIHYGPTHGYGLLGGVWAGPTFWFAFAAAPFNTEFMAYALSVSFQHYAHDPRRNNTVPGQFSEWLHGETLTNQGMMLSPWFAPKYLWAAIEGAGGLDVSVSPPALRPRLASTWMWMAVRNVNLQRKNVSWIACRLSGLSVFATHGFPGVEDDRVYAQDISNDVRTSGEDVIRVAFARADRVLIFIGNTRDRTVSTAVKLREGALSGKYRLRAYNSLRSEWTEEEHFDAAGLERGLPVQVNRRGFCLLEFNREAS